SCGLQHWPHLRRILLCTRLSGASARRSGSDPMSVAVPVGGSCGPGPRREDSWITQVEWRPRCAHSEEALVFTETTSLGLDVHARSVSAAAIVGATGELIRKNLSSDLAEIRGFATDLARDHGALRITY